MTAVLGELQAEPPPASAKGRQAALSCPSSSPSMLASTAGLTATMKPSATSCRVEISTSIRGPLATIFTAVPGVLPAELPPVLAKGAERL